MSKYHYHFIIIIVDTGIDPYLNGIGFLGNLQYNGIDVASMAGGAEIMIYGVGMTPTP